MPRPLPHPQAVDYAAIGRSPQFEDYLQCTAELKRVDVKSLSHQEKVAFFCNVYNALVIHAFVVHGPPSNIFKRLRVSMWTAVTTRSMNSHLDRSAVCFAG